MINNCFKLHVLAGLTLSHFNNQLAYIDPSGHISFTVGQFTSLVKGIVDGAVLDDLKSMFNLDTYKVIFEFGSAVIKGNVNFVDVAKSVGASFAEPFKYLAKHSEHVWTGKPSDQEVYEYGKRMGNVIQMAAGVVGGSAVGAKLMKALGKVSPKLAKTVAKLVDNVEDAFGNSRGSFRLSKGTSQTVDNAVINLKRTGSALKDDYVYPVINNKNQIVKEFPSVAKAHGFTDIIDNYAGDAVHSVLDDGADLYQILGSNNGVAGRFEWIVDGGNVTHRMFIEGGTINGVPTLP